MINLEELRLGNYVIDDGSPVKITRPFMAYLLERKVSDIEPVPLSPDLLEKCGFKQSNEFDDTFRLNQFDVFYRKTYCEWTVDDRGDNEGSKPRIFRHLHQLQNLIYAVTGSELPINL